MTDRSTCWSSCSAPAPSSPRPTSTRPSTWCSAARRTRCSPPSPTTRSCGARTGTGWWGSTTTPAAGSVARTGIRSTARPVASTRSEPTGSPRSVIASSTGRRWSTVPELTALEIDTEADLAVASALAPLVDPRPALLDVAAVATDFDGVHTDDRVLVDQHAVEAVRVSRGDGLGVSLLREAGVPFVIVSKERNPVVGARGGQARGRRPAGRRRQGVRPDGVAGPARARGPSGGVRGQRHQRPAGDGGGRLADRRRRRPSRGAARRPAGAHPTRRTGRGPRGLRPGPHRAVAPAPAADPPPRPDPPQPPQHRGGQQQSRGLAPAPPRRSASARPRRAADPPSRRRTRSVTLSTRSSSPTGWK